MVASLPGVKEMYSSTSKGRFWGYASFTRGTDTRYRVIELQDRVTGVMQQRLHARLSTDQLMAFFSEHANLGTQIRDLCGERRF